MEQHYQLELRRLAEGNLVPEPSDDASNKAKRGAAVAAANSMKSARKGKGPAQELVDDNEQVLLRRHKSGFSVAVPVTLSFRALTDVFFPVLKLLFRVKANRMKRSASARGDTGTRKRQRTSDTGDELYGSGTCFMCNEILPSDPEAVNAHIDTCLAIQAAASSPSSSDDETGGVGSYSWAGQSRVRATDLIEGGFAASGYLVHKKTDADVDEEVDIEDDDTEQFGEPQYGEEDIR
ncbi:hypothetical protein HK104_004772, partial [Borealophlyctis nickersoniae]